MCVCVCVYIYIYVIHTFILTVDTLNRCFGTFQDKKSRLSCPSTES